jgi:hypothetical protein
MTIFKERLASIQITLFTTKISSTGKVSPQGRKFQNLGKKATTGVDLPQSTQELHSGEDRALIGTMPTRVRQPHAIWSREWHRSPILASFKTCL